MTGAGASKDTQATTRLEDITLTTEQPAPPIPLLEIRVTQTDGSVSRFAQDDPALVKRILDAIQPARLFSVPLLTLGGDGALTVFPTSRIERVDLIGDSLPNWPYLGGAAAIREIAEEAFLAAYDPAQSVADRQKAGDVPGTTQAGYTEYATISGRHVYWEVQMESRPMTRMDFGPYIQSLFSAGGLHARTEEGGVTILNPATITRLVFHPGPPTLPINAWPARRL
jgi:hypothetical protein